MDHSAVPGRVAFLRTANENLRRPETLAPVAHSPCLRIAVAHLSNTASAARSERWARDVTYLRFVSASRRIRT